VHKVSEIQIAVLIDFENVGLGSIQHLFDQLSDVGRIIVKRAYADWSTGGRKLRDQLLEMGIEAVHHFRAGPAKNSSDIHLAVDAIEILYRSPVDTFVIVSADSDFVSLVSKLRAAGKTVIGAGRRDVVSPTLVRSCDRYIYLEVAVNQDSQTKASPKDVESLLIRAMEASIDDQGKVPGSKLHQTITRIDPSFDFQALGYRTFMQFLETAEPLVKISRNPGSWDIDVELKKVDRGLGLSRVSMSLGKIIGRHPQTSRRDHINAGGNSENYNGQTGDSQNPEVEEQWELRIHNAWSSRAREIGTSINGTWAAGEAARAMGATKLSSSKYKTLQRLLAVSSLLGQRWSRDGNTLIRKE